MSSSTDITEERERLFVYESWPNIPVKVRQSILRKAQAFASSTFPEANPPASDETTPTAEKPNER
jgi:hypothetical protein